MANGLRLLLIIAQSGRMLAQSAAREGYTVRVADCFGDIDTLDIADRYLKLPPLDDITELHWLQAITALSDEQPCSLICGTGAERFYPVISQLPAHIEFAGPSFASFEQICIPQKWIALLKTLSLPYPPTQFKKNPTVNGKWLAKSATAWGGTHIIEANSGTEKPDRYYQQYIEGVSGSVLFLANSNDCQLLLFNQQFTRNSGLFDFSLKAIASGLPLDLEQQQFLHKTLQKLTLRLGLSGLMSLDFQLNPSGEIFLLEINPRPTASCQLLPADYPIISWQLMSSAGDMPEVPAELPAKKRILWFCFAPEKITIPADFNWPDYCHDLPAGGSIIEKGGIICSLLLTQEITELNDGHQLANKLIENLSTAA